MKDLYSIRNACFKFLLFTLFFDAVFIFSSQAQDTDFKFRHITTNSGLSQSNVTCILQDYQGFMWFGTQDGLNKFDGYSFTLYRNIPGDSTSLSSNYITSLVEDKDKNIWVATQGGGLNRLDRESDTFARYTHNPNDPNSISTNKLKTVYADKSGVIWIGTDGAGLDVFDYEHNSFTHFTHDSSNPASIGANVVNTIYEDSRGNIWVGAYYGSLNLLNRNNNQFTRIPVDGSERGLHGASVSQIIEDSSGALIVGTLGGGLSIYNQDTGVFTHYLHNNNDSVSISNNNVTSVAEDRFSNIWIGTQNGGLDILHPNGEITHYRSSADNPNSINNNSIYAIYRDRINNMWVGTFAGGVNLHLGIAEKFTHIKQNSDNPQGLNHNEILAMVEDRNGNIWFGTDGGGVNKLDRNTGTFTHFMKNDTDPTAMIDNVIIGLEEDSKGNIWLGTLSKGISILEKNSNRFINYEYRQLKRHSQDRWHAIIDMIKDHKGDMWIASWGGGLSHYEIAKDSVTHYERFENDSPADKPASNIVLAVYEDRMHNIWMGTVTDGLSVWDRKTGRFTHYSHDPLNSQSLSGNLVNAFYQDKNGNMWVATNGGLNLFDPETKTFKSFKVEDGLPNNVIQSILEDATGDLWLSTNKGISHFNIATKTFKNYDVSDGLQANEFKRQSSLKSRTGEMFFGGANGFNVFHPDSIRDNPNIPEVHITNFQIFNKPVLIGGEGSPLEKHISQTKEITLPYDQSVFTLDFAALNYALSEKNQYAYLLEGFDKEWNYVGNKRSATYTNLDPGSYTFKVKGSNNDGVWNENGTSLSIIITPPYWQTWWFRTLVALTIVGGAFAFYQVRMNAIKAQKVELEKQVEERTLEVVSQKEELQAQAEVLIDTNSALKERQQEILLQREQIEAQHSILEITNTKVMDSISYANSIQKAILPSSEKVATALPEHFILYRPKDIVSGDFYWFSHITAVESNGKADKDFSFIAVIDCTGHGVPGAFMSIIGSNLLNEIVNLRHILDPAQILEELDKGVMRSVEQTEGVNTAGMDVCLLKIEQEIDGMKITFSGAKRPIFVVKKGEMEIETIEADRRSIGALKVDHPFTNQEIFVKKGTMLYLSSDGYIDQNNPDRRKLGTPKLKECILHAVNHPMKEQLRIFENALDAHQQQAEQRDDITLVGFRV